MRTGPAQIESRQRTAVRALPEQRPRTEHLVQSERAVENVAAEDEPGNQLASWDIRWASPIGDWNYALYNQHTGETIDNKIPRPYRSMDVVGLETWGEGAGDGSSWRAGLEYANTRCGGTENGEKLWDCAYNNGIFTDGYRYYDEVMARLEETDLGHSELKKYLEDDKITVRELGGYECAKCHY